MPLDQALANEDEFTSDRFVLVLLYDDMEEQTENCSYADSTKYKKVDLYEVQECQILSLRNPGFTSNIALIIIFDNLELRIGFGGFVDLRIRFDAKSIEFVLLCN